MDDRTKESLETLAISYDEGARLEDLDEPPPSKGQQS
jgi:hypothetical protein